jgi:uncharacterized protein YdeI (YjbR/CyaY-like superfamily)
MKMQWIFMNEMTAMLQVSDRKNWRAWLEENHSTENEVWLIYFKKHTGKPGISYEEAVEEALCFGWIDSIVRKIDAERYCQKFSPRRENSNWSRLNKKRIEKLIENGRMTEFGLAKVEVARVNGSWDKKVVSEQSVEMPVELLDLLEKNKEAKDFFNDLRPSFQKQYIGWIASAKKCKTRQRRASEAVKLLEKKQKLGLR